LQRREALWAIRALRDTQLPLFEAMMEQSPAAPEVVEPPVALRPMTGGREVVEDYGHIGLTLRQHPVSFLREAMADLNIVPCRDLLTARDGQRLTVAGLVLVRQRPGSANGVMFITIEDETGTANLVVWPDTFERERRVVLSAGMLAVRGKVQRDGEVIHVVATRLHDMTPLLRTVGEREGGAPFPLPHGRGDEARSGGGPDSRDPNWRKARDIYVKDLRIKAAIRVKPRDFR
jgi:error-prone DNA polymerase